MNVGSAIEDGQPITIEDEGKLFEGWYFGHENGLWAHHINSAGLLRRRWVDAHPSEFAFMAPLALSMLVHADEDAPDRDSETA
jgi:hypothetical protein